MPKLQNRKIATISDRNIIKLLYDLKSQSAPKNRGRIASKAVEKYPSNRLSNHSDFLKLQRCQIASGLALKSLPAWASKLLALSCFCSIRPMLEGPNIGQK